MINEQSKQIYIFKNTLFPIVKVGMSDNPSKRLTTIENASGFTLELYFESTPIKRPRIVEGLIHKRLNEYRQKGEWFTINPEKAKEIIQQIINDSEAGEYKDLIVDFQLQYECTTVFDYAIVNNILTDNNGNYKEKFVEQEEYIYKDSQYNYYLIYTQGEIIRTVRFCNYNLAKKFKKVYFKILLKIK